MFQNQDGESVHFEHVFPKVTLELLEVTAVESTGVRKQLVLCSNKNEFPGTFIGCSNPSCSGGMNVERTIKNMIELRLSKVFNRTVACAKPGPWDDDLEQSPDCTHQFEYKIAIQVSD